MCNRTGIVAVSLLPIVTLLSGRNSPAALLSGMTFSVQMLYHRWTARLLAVSVLWHAAGYTGSRVISGGTAGWQDMLSEEYVRWGAVVSPEPLRMQVKWLTRIPQALSCFIGLCFFSLTIIRRFSYEAFLVLHITLAAFALAGVYQHLSGQGRDDRVSHLALQYQVRRLTLSTVWRHVRLCRSCNGSVGL